MPPSTAPLFALPPHTQTLLQPPCSTLPFHTPPRCPPKRQRAVATVHPHASPVEIRLRSLGADAAADLCYVALSSHGPSLVTPDWQTILTLFAERGITGDILSRIAQRLGVPQLLKLRPQSVRVVLQTLRDLGLSDDIRNRVISQRPELLGDAGRVEGAVQALREVMTVKDVKGVVIRWPGVLLLDAGRIRAVTRFLMSRHVGFDKEGVRPLLRRASWVLVYDVDEMMGGVSLLQEGLEEGVKEVVRASPLVLGLGRGRMREVMGFLSEEVGLGEGRMKAVVRAFPPVLTCEVGRLRGGLRFLKREVGLGGGDVVKVVRAFPAVLTLEVEGMKRVLRYFRGRGVRNVARLVRRLPPVLGYELEVDVVPKMEFLEGGLGLGWYEVLKFPGFFSYSLEKRIVPRTLFLQARGVSLGEVGLNLAVGLTDREFCERVGGVEVAEYVAFREALAIRRGKERKRGGGVGGDKRRKRRFRATLSRLPWNELK